MPIQYALEPDLSSKEFFEILVNSTLAERRPVKELERLERMLRCADIVATARDGKRLVGLARAITDFAYCCYLSDLAVDVAYQRQGVGKRLIEMTRSVAGEGTTLILLAAPAAETYYPKIGMQRVTSCWAIPRNS
jgi:GNAT superfamily N-acetyltransferase